MPCDQTDKAARLHPQIRTSVAHVPVALTATNHGRAHTVGSAIPITAVFTRQERPGSRGDWGTLSQVACYVN